MCPVTVITSFFSRNSLRRSNLQDVAVKGCSNTNILPARRCSSHTRTANSTMVTASAYSSGTLVFGSPVRFWRRENNVHGGHATTKHGQSLLNILITLCWMCSFLKSHATPVTGSRTIQSRDQPPLKPLSLARWQILGGEKISTTSYTPLDFFSWFSYSLFSLRSSASSSASCSRPPLFLALSTRFISPTFIATSSCAGSSVARYCPGRSCSSVSSVASRPLLFGAWTSIVDSVDALVLALAPGSPLAASAPSTCPRARFPVPPSTALSTCRATYSCRRSAASCTLLDILSSASMHFFTLSLHCAVCARLVTLGSFLCIPSHFGHLIPCSRSSVYPYLPNMSSRMFAARGIMSGTLGTSIARSSSVAPMSTARGAASPASRSTTPRCCPRLSSVWSPCTFHGVAVIPITASRFQLSPSGFNEMLLVFTTRPSFVAIMCSSDTTLFPSHTPSSHLRAMLPPCVFPGCR